MKIFSKKQKDDAFFLIDDYAEEIEVGETLPEPTHALTPAEVLGQKTTPTERFDSKSALESLKARMRESTKDIRPAETLLERCKPYILDEDGNDTSVDDKPSYQLESVAEILQNDSQKTIDDLAKKYDISFDYLGKFVAEKTAEFEPKKAEPKKSEPPKAEPKKEFIPKEKESFEETIVINTPVRNIQSSVPFSISETESKIPEPQKPAADFSNTATITFTPISSTSSSKPKIFVTSNTKPLDLTQELEDIEKGSFSEKTEKVKLEKDDFEDFNPDDEIKTDQDVKKFLRKFSISKRSHFLITSFSVILTLALAFFKLPFMSGAVLGSTKPTMIACTAITAVITILNCGMFLSIPKIFTKKSNADVLSSIAAIAVLLYAVFGIIGGEIVLDILLLLAIILCIRALNIFRKDSFMLSNLKQMSTPNYKNAVNLIDDKAVCFAMAKNSVEGDALIAAPQKCKRLNDFIKYSTFGTFMDGKVSVIAVLSLILSIIVGIATANYFSGAVYGLYAAAAIQCFAALPSLFFIDAYPLYAAAKRLNRSGSMIAGKTGAKHLELANAMVIDSNTIFPSGTVTLHQIKILSDNSVDETLLRAASLTSCLNSPLAPIFQKIAGESNIITLPDSDTVKYENNLGISGWVDNKRLFIGNRTLMEAHGISVPSIEVDRKILENGFFPVYVASENKACALLVVQYSVSPEVALQLRKITKMGVTLLINNADPNISAEMVCDYLGLYEDSVMVMTNAGCHMYKNTLAKTEACSAPALYRANPLSLARLIISASKITKSNALLTVLYIISAILGIIIFAYSSFAGSDALIGGNTVLLYSLICTVITYLLYLTQKP